MFILRLAQQPQGYYDSGRYVTLSTDILTFTFSIDLAGTIQWRSDWSTNEEVNFNVLHTDATRINYQMVQ